MNDAQVNWVELVSLCPPGSYKMLEQTSSILSLKELDYRINNPELNPNGRREQQLK
jgi:hypothetical protein